MDNQKYLDEERYQKNAKRLKIIGGLVLAIGLVIFLIGIALTFVGFTDFGSNAANMNLDVEVQAGKVVGSMGMFALGGFLDMVGFGMLAAGAIIIFIAHKREIAAFTTQQIMPVAKEGIDEIAPTIGNAAGEIAKGITKGVQDAKESSSEKEDE